MENGNTCPSTLSKDGLESMLGSPVLSFSLGGSACADGDNMAGTVLKLKVTLENEKTLPLIFKHIPHDPPDFIIHSQMYWREHAMYKTIFPELKKFLEKKGITSASYTLPIPKFYAGFNNDKDDYLLMEDVSASGFTMPDKMRSLNFSEMSLILKEMAKFHALSYAFLKQGGKDAIPKEEWKFVDTENPSSDYFAPADPNDPDGPTGFELLSTLFFNVGSDIVKEERPELTKRIDKINDENVWKIKREAFMRKSPPYFQTLIHSDLWTNNLLIKYEENEAKEVKFVDFQLTQIGNIFPDLEYTIFTSTSRAFRKQYLIPLLELYYDEFASFLEDEVKTDLPPGFTKEFLIEEFQESWLLPGLIHMTFAIPLQIGDLVGATKEAIEAGEDPVGSAKGIIHMYRKSKLAMERLIDMYEETAEYGAF